MKKYAWVAVVPALLAVLALSGGGQGADAKPTIKQIMQKAHGGPNSLKNLLLKELKDDEPDWDEIQGQTKVYVALVSELSKNKPPKGEAASWQKLTSTFTADVRALDAAARKKDKRAALAAHMKVSKFCSSCHDVHKPDDD
jgi:hypothetical protein